MSAITDDLTLNVEQEIEIKAPPDGAFAALLEQLGPRNTGINDQPLNLKIEPWPGGRWFRDLKDQNGHLWGHVQVIKRPTLLEISGPLFMSYPAVSHVQFRIAPRGRGSTLSLRHQALGLIDPAHREGVGQGWKQVLEGARSHAERR